MEEPQRKPADEAQIARLKKSLSIGQQVLKPEQVVQAFDVASQLEGQIDVPADLLAVWLAVGEVIACAGARVVAQGQRSNRFSLQELLQMLAGPQEMALNFEQPEDTPKTGPIENRAELQERAKSAGIVLV